MTKHPQCQAIYRAQLSDKLDFDDEDLVSLESCSAHAASGDVSNARLFFDSNHDDDLEQSDVGTQDNISDDQMMQVDSNDDFQADGQPAGDEPSDWDVDDEEDDEGGVLEVEDDGIELEITDGFTGMAVNSNALDLDLTISASMSSGTQVSNTSTAALERHPQSSPQAKIYVERIPQAGAPLSCQEPQKHAFREYQDSLRTAADANWEVAKWAKLRGPGSTAVSELLGIDGIQEALRLSYKNSHELNRIIDAHLPGLPRFTRKKVNMGKMPYDLYFRCPIKCIAMLFGNPELCNDLLLAPERQFVDETKAERLFHEMNTGLWWWQTQKELEKIRAGATIAPVIISTDKTQVTTFRSKQAYPVYMAIGNIPKNIRRKPSRHAHVLLAYLPVTKLEHLDSIASRRRALANLFHACMGYILHPLRKPGMYGVQMVSGDGIIRRVHPILAVHAADYPEQVLVTCTKTGECPKCLATNRELGDPTVELEYRDLAAILDALALADTDLVSFKQRCMENRIKPVPHPFWEKLPFVNIFRSITADVLHQIYQGIVKHIFSWVIKIYGAAEIDARCQRFPPNHHIRIFSKGISSLSRLTGQEHNQMCHFLLGLLIAAPFKLPNAQYDQRVIRAIRAILDFIYLAQLPMHSTRTLEQLESALDTFHGYMTVFIDLNIHTNMNLPKLHSFRHYIETVKLFGTVDNYNTEYTERLHIDLAKDAHCATNQKDEFAQMTIWLERKEKIVRHAKYRMAFVRTHSSRLNYE
ncbi:hypothetical protein AX17_004123 [Amanita inopinata Kibby_2008]|nr:hypothetical protein AX17_004123 [Amanita inopinata Kibby_2008]